MQKFNLITTLTLNAAGYTKGLNEAKASTSKNMGEMRKELQQLRNISFDGKTEEEIENITRQIGELSDEMADLRAVQKGLGGSIGEAFTGALMGLTQVAEGAVGVANIFGVSKEKSEQLQKAMINLIGISQALSAIDELVQEKRLLVVYTKIKDTAVTVSNTVATKAATIAQWQLNSQMNASIIGVVAIAVGALATGLGFLIKNQLASAEAAKKETEALKQQNDLRILNRDTLQEVQSKAFESYNKQITQVQKLVQTITGETTSLKDKQTALRQLISLDPDYLKGLDLSNIKTDLGRKLIGEYVEALKKKSLAEAQAAQMSELQLKQFQKEQEIRNAEVGKSVRQAQLTNLQNRYLTANAEKQIYLSHKIEEKNKQLEEEENRLNKLNAEHQDISKQVQFFSDKVDENSVSVEFNTDLLNKDNDSKGEAISLYGDLTKQISEINSKIKEYILLGKDIKPLTLELQRIQGKKDNVDQIVEQQTTEYISSQVTLPGNIDDTFDKINKDILDWEPEPIELKLKPIPTDELLSLSDIAGIATNSINMLGEAFITMQEGGEVSFQQLIGSMLSGLRQVIFGLLAQAIAGMIAGESTKGLPGLITAAVGVTAISQLFASLPKFASGGIVSGQSYSGDNLIARVNSGEMILNQSQQAKLFEIANNGGVGGEVRFEIEGSKLIGVLNNYNKRMKGIR